jgi:hypothetical protein
MAGVMYDFFQNIFTPTQNQIEKQEKYEIKNNQDNKINFNPEFKNFKDKI